MTTRLDRLFLLLDTGSTPAIRKSAADQLGEVQKLHPHELHNLLSKVHSYLCSGSWDTRVAAGQAVEAIARNVPPWQPEGRPKQEDAGSPFPAAWGRLQLSQFEVSKVLVHGASLLGSEGAEYDLEEENIGLDERERLARQRKMLNKRLGLDVAPGLGIKTEDWFEDDDLVMSQETQPWDGPQASVKELLQNQLQKGGNCFDMSARERNRAKRKAKMLARQTSRDPERKNGDGAEDEPANKLRKVSSVVLDQPDQDKIVLDTVPDNTLNMEEMDDWPFEAFCELLMNDLFNSNWEKRHGAATGLREVLKLHGSSAGITPDMSTGQMKQQNQLWLEDLALRIICVLALDRFGDFVSDEVVAPVRETCAQTLGVALHHMSCERVQLVVQVLLQLLQQNQWEVRHGGLLGLKYVLAVRKDVTDRLLPLVLPAIFSGLQDQDDDVRAVAAAALLPVTDILVKLMPQQIKAIVECLWHTLLDLDDLTASTNSIMTLLSCLLEHPEVSAESLTAESLTELVPRLWPFLRHSITSVRQAALETLHTLLTRCQHQNTAMWVLPILADTMRHVYQRSLLEGKQAQLDVVYKTWSGLLASIPLDHLACASSPWLGSWFCLMMQPSKMAFEPTLLIEAKHTPKEMTPSRVRHSSETRQLQQQQLQEQMSKEYLGGSVTLNSTAPIRDMVVVRVRRTAARMLGLLTWYLSQPIPNIPEGLETPLESASKILVFHLSSKSALQRMCVAMVILEWATVKKDCTCMEMVKAKLQECLVESIYFDEIAVSFTRMQTECQNFTASLKQQGVETDSLVPSGILTLEQAQALSTTVYESVKSKLKPRQHQLFEDRRQQVLATVTQTSYEQQVFSVRVQALLAGAMTALECLPERMNPVIRPLMESLKKEENDDLQGCSACSVSQLVRLRVGQTPCPNPKVIKNLCNLLCSDPAFTPGIESTVTSSAATDAASRESSCDTHSGILTLSAQQKVPECTRGRKPSVPKKVFPAGVTVSLDAILNEDDEAKKLLLIQRRGATLALRQMACDFGAALPDQAAPLWEAMLCVLDSTEKIENDATDQTEKAQELVNSLQVLEVIGPALDASLHSELLRRLEPVCSCLQHPYTTVRHLASRCLGMLSKVVTTGTMNHVLEHLLPSLSASDNNVARQGAIEALANIIEQLGMDLVPYIVLLVVPVLGCMSDQVQCVRLMATQCFATLIRLMPLEAGIPDPPAMKASLVQQKERERKFLEQLLDGSKIDNYKVPVPIKAELRKYQQDGVNWLAFLSKYKLHGILCDDMGLGKTLQSLCLLAGDNYHRAEKYKKCKSADSAPLPSIVVCPPTLTGHWVYEVEKFVDKEHLNPLHYTGTPTERQRLQQRVKKHNLIVASYDVVRNDIEFFGALKWNYCILDEGHIIKNSKTKLSRAVKQLSCNHRLILSGTPIQNNVLELWSLFDFLMPGFLGTEKQFQSRYGRPILQCRDAKSSSKEQEAGALAMEALHRQVLPFLLRRLKEDVLKDLPPKILQDYYCELSPLQVQLYEDFAKSRAKKSVEDTVHTVEEKKAAVKGSTHIFQALQYLRKVCNHPSLVLTAQHPEHDRITALLKKQGSKLRDIQHAPKLTALKQLLNDCGIGVTGSDAVDAPVVNQHRVLLFCQLKSMLDIVEKDLFKTHMPSVTYMRLDGSVPAGNRHSIVNRFNNDPSIDVLLLTTHVGGLGLNLTGADTVIFVEHDWNPMKDLQAMDRAHRIGQKKVVNVYRLVTRGTLEEKIMGLQKFKINIANTIISQENSSLASMGTDQLLDLFSLDEGKKGAAASTCQSDADSAQSSSLKSVLENMEELWDVKQYEDEYDLGSFMKGLGK